MKTFLTTFLLSTITLTCSAQHNLGVKLTGGLSQITNNSTNVLNGEYKVLVTPSANLGLYYNFEISEKFSIGTELLFSQIEGRERIDQLNTDSDGTTTIGSSYIDIEKHISYLSLPIYFGFRINNLTVNLGAQASFTLTSSGRETLHSISNGKETTWDNKYDKLYIDTYDYGPRAGLTYDLTDNIAIDGSFYYGINNILHSGSSTWKWQVRQATIGIRYTFLSTKPHNT